MIYEDRTTGETRYSAEAQRRVVSKLRGVAEDEELPRAVRLMANVEIVRVLGDMLKERQ